jgi:glycylpeptide N-tetradecanoyltransferase
MNDFYNFLYDNYNQIEDNVGLHYSKESLKWYLDNPKNFKDMFLFVKYKNKVVGSIIGTPINISIFDTVNTIIDTSFLCINKSIRHKSLAALMIKELLRRMYNNGVKYGYYTSPLTLPNALTKSNYYHKIINIKKMLDINFISKPSSISIKSYEKLFRLNDTLNTDVRKLTLNDIDKCMNLYNSHYKKYKIYQMLTRDDFIYKFMSVDNIIDTYVLELNNEIICFASLFYVKSRLFNNQKYTDYTIAQIYHYAYTDIDIFKLFLNDIFILMKNKQIDVINWVEQMDNKILLEKLNFKQGSGELYFYFWNKRCPEITNKDIALVTI